MTAPAPPTSDPAARPPLIRHPGRVLTVVLVFGVVVTLGIWAISSAETDTGITRNAPTLPSAIETLDPGPGELARPQATITVDLRDDLTGVLVIDPPDGPAFEVPEDQTDRIVPLGQLGFRTGPDRELERLEPGSYTVTVLYWPQARTRPDQPSGYTWGFRAGA